MRRQADRVPRIRAKSRGPWGPRQLHPPTALPALGPKRGQSLPGGHRSPGTPGTPLSGEGCGWPRRSWEGEPPGSPRGCPAQACRLYLVVGSDVEKQLSPLDPKRVGGGRRSEGHLLARRDIDVRQGPARIRVLLDFEDGVAHRADWRVGEGGSVPCRRPAACRPARRPCPVGTLGLGRGHEQWQQQGPSPHLGGRPPAGPSEQLAAAGGGVSARATFAPARHRPTL